MRRVVSLYLPSWPTDRLRRSGSHAAPPPDEPLATVAQDGARRVLAGLDAAARRLGLSPGMSAAQAVKRLMSAASSSVAAGRERAREVRTSATGASSASPMISMSGDASVT